MYVSNFFPVFVIIGIIANVLLNKFVQQTADDSYYMHKSNDDVAFATMVTPAFCMGAIALGHSIQKFHGDKIDRICLVTSDVNNTWREILQQWWKVYEVPEVKPMKNYRRSWVKLQLWRFTQYSKILYLDSDTLLFGNIEKLFTYPQLSCVNDINPPFICNTGVLVLEPSNKTYFDMVEKSKLEDYQYTEGDQYFLNAYFKTFNPLSAKYNAPRLDNSGFPNAFRAGKIKVVHFICKKPWKCGREGVSYCGCGYPELNSIWYEYFDEACKGRKCVECWYEKK